MKTVLILAGLALLLWWATKPRDPRRFASRGLHSVGGRGFGPVGDTGLDSRGRQCA